MSMEDFICERCDNHQNPERKRRAVLIGTPSASEGQA